MGRAPCCDKANVKRGPWSPEEDAKLKDYIDKHGTAGNWIALPQKAGLKRCGKSCRLRWLNYLRPNIKHGEFSDDEDKLICTLFANIGSRWSIIAAQLPGRTDNDIKNYWNTKLKKKLLMVHNPFNSPHQKIIRPPNNNYQFPCSSVSSQMPPTFRYSSNNNINTYTTLAASRSFTSNYNENISNISSSPLNLQPQDHFLGPMQNYQGKESSFIMFGADQQAASCSSSDGSNNNNNNNNNNNKDQVEYEKLMMFNGLDISSNPLDYKSLEEIKQLISTSNLSSCNSNIMNLFEDESTAAEEEKVLMYY